MFLKLMPSIFININTFDHSAKYQNQKNEGEEKTFLSFPIGVYHKGRSGLEIMVGS